MNYLNEYGFQTYLHNLIDYTIDDNRSIARIIAQHKGRYNIVCDSGIIPAELSGQYHYLLEEKGGYPVVGDYVYISGEESGLGVIQDLLPRTSLFFRKDGWSKEGVQILASNFDTILLCTSLNRDFNITRLMRYMILSSESNAKIGIVLTKSDLCTPEEATEKVILCKKRFPNVNVTVASAYTREGLDQLNQYFKGTETVILLGSSGVGKSTLVNAISEEEIMKVGAIREYDDKGRHTTVHRQIIKLPKGGVLIDTPGIREIGLVNAQDGLSIVYDQIEQLARQCKYSNCTHTHEDGCAIQKAISNGEIDIKQFEEYLKLLHENEYEENKEQFMFDKWQKSKQKSRNYRQSRKQKRKERRR